MIFRADLPSCAVQQRNDTIVGAHFGRAGQGPKMNPCRATRLVERTADLPYHTTCAAPKQTDSHAVLRIYRW
jgi:hypothetical protein